MKIKLLNPDCMPTKKYAFDAGWDLRASESLIICPGEVAKIGAGIAVEIPKGYVGDIRPRSSISAEALKGADSIVTPFLPSTPNLTGLASALSGEY